MSGHFERPVVRMMCFESLRPVLNVERKQQKNNPPLYLLQLLISVSPRAAAMTLRTVLLSLQALLAAAEPDDPQDAVVANQVRERHLLFF